MRRRYVNDSFVTTLFCATLVSGFFLQFETTGVSFLRSECTFQTSNARKTSKKKEKTSQPLKKRQVKGLSNTVQPTCVSDEESSTKCNPPKLSPKANKKYGKVNIAEVIDKYDHLTISQQSNLYNILMAKIWLFD